MSRTRVRFRLLVVLILSGLGSGCNDSPAIVPVTGTVTLDGKPLANAEVVFVPDPSKGTKGDNASGITDAQGRFTLRIGRTGQNGAAAGFYRVIVTDLASVPDLTTADAVPVGGGIDTPPKSRELSRSRVPAVYSDPAKTPLSDVEVRTGTPEINITLQSTR